MPRGATRAPDAPIRYQSPRTLNLFSVLVYLGLAAIAYGSWKFLPVYYQRFKVDSVLDDAANRALKLRGRLNSEATRRISSDVHDLVRRRLARLDLFPEAVDAGGHGLIIRFGPNYRDIQAHYTVVVRHPFVKRTTRLEFDRRSAISGAWDDE